MPISNFPSVKTSRKSKRTSARNRSKDWKHSWLEYRSKKNLPEVIDIYITPSMSDFWK